MIELLAKWFIPHRDSMEGGALRRAYGTLCGAVGIGLNILLAVLLAAALFMGWRLNRRLNVLRDSQEGFARAVGELNGAALRAERGLAELRAASDEASEILTDRVEKARARKAASGMMTISAIR